MDYEKLGVNRLTAEFRAKREERTLKEMWNGLCFTAGFTALFGVIMATHTMPIFYLIASVVVIIGAWKLSKI